MLSCAARGEPSIFVQQNKPKNYTYPLKIDSALGSWTGFKLRVQHRRSASLLRDLLSLIEVT